MTKLPTDTKVSSSWSNIEEFPDESSLPKTSKREKKRSKTGKSEKRQVRIRERQALKALNRSPSICETKRKTTLDTDTVRL